MKRLIACNLRWLCWWLLCLGCVNGWSTPAFDGPEAKDCPKKGLYLYTGEQIDPDLGMYYLRARYYQPGIGRFWNMDSYEGSQRATLSLHKYLYCRGTPVNGVDPSGHDLTSISVSSAIGGALIGMSLSPGIANAPGPRDPTYSSDGSAGLGFGIVGGVAIANLVKYAVGPAIAKMWSFYRPAKRAQLLKARSAYPDEFSGTAVANRLEVKPGMPDGHYMFVVDQNGRMWAIRPRTDLHHNSLVPKEQGVLAAGNLKVEGGGTKITANGGSGHYNVNGPDGAFGSGEAKAFEAGVKELLDSLGFEVKGVSHSQFFPSEASPFN